MARKFIAPGARAGDGHGYMNRPLRSLDNTLEPDSPEVVDLIAGATRLTDEPEACSEDLADYARTAQFHQTLRHMQAVEQARELRPLLRAEDRIRDAQRRAKQSKRRDLSGEFLALRGMLDRYRRADQEPKPGSSLLNRLERVEAKLDGVNDLAA